MHLIVEKIFQKIGQQHAIPLEFIVNRSLLPQHLLCTRCHYLLLLSNGLTDRGLVNYFSFMEFTSCPLTMSFIFSSIGSQVLSLFK